MDEFKPGVIVHIPENTRLFVFSGAMPNRSFEFHTTTTFKEVGVIVDKGATESMVCVYVCGTLCHVRKKDCYQLVKEEKSAS